MGTLVGRFNGRIDRRESFNAASLFWLMQVPEDVNACDHRLTLAPQ